MIILARVKSSIFLLDKEEWGSLRGFGRDNMTGFEMFLDKGFACVFFSRIQWVDFGNLRSKDILEVDGMVKGSVRGKLFIGLFRKYIDNVGAEFRDGYFFRFLCLGDFCRYGEFVQLFICKSIQGRALTKSPLNLLGIGDNRGVFGVKIDSECFPVDFGVPFLEPGHTKDDLGMKKTNDHKFNCVRERFEGEGNNDGLMNGSFGVRSSINIISGDGQRYLRQFEDSEG